jgi:hypothetical protein
VAAKINKWLAVNIPAAEGAHQPALGVGLGVDRRGGPS